MALVSFSSITDDDADGFGDSSFFSSTFFVSFFSFVGASTFGFSILGILGISGISTFGRSNLVVSTVAVDI